MADETDYPPDTPVPITGTYRKVNMNGTLSEIRIFRVKGDPLPAAPLGRGWRLEQPTEAPT